MVYASTIIGDDLETGHNVVIREENVIGNKFSIWNNSTVVREIAPAEIEKLKQEPGKDIIIYGSASIVQALTNLGLIDEYQLLVHPFVLGAGKPLFANIEQRVNLKLVDSKTHPSGVVVLYYQPA